MKSNTTINRLDRQNFMSADKKNKTSVIDIFKNKDVIIKSIEITVACTVAAIVIIGFYKFL